MKLQVTQENLSKALNNVARVASTRNSLPILSNILIKTADNRLVVAATDLNIAITHFLGAKVAKSGSITVPARLLQDLVSSLPGGIISLSLEETKLHISTDQHKSVINGTPAGDFPIMPKIKNGHTWKMKTPELENALNQTIFAASNDSARPVLTGVNFTSSEGRLYVAATDSYRLTEKKIGKITKGTKLLIPASSLQDLLRILDDTEEETSITNDNQQVVFKSGDVELVTRLIDGSFPDYKKLIPKNFKTSAVVSKNDLSGITKVSSLFARETAGSVTLDINGEKNEISINSLASQLGENSATAPAKTSGTGKITLNSRYIMDALNTINTETVFVGFNEKLEPFVIKEPDNNDYTHVIMPLKS